MARTLMMKGCFRYICVIFFLFLFSHTNAQKHDDTGAGYFLWEINEYPFIPANNITGVCFIEPTDSMYFEKVVLKDIDQKEILNCEFLDSTGETIIFKGKKYTEPDSVPGFTPWWCELNPEDFRLFFDCVDTIGKYDKVKINETEFAYIPKSEGDFKIAQYSALIKESTTDPNCLDFDRTTNPLRTEPDKNSGIIKDIRFPQYKIWEGYTLEVKGDWLKIRTVNYEVGWIKWREGEKILIRIGFYD